MRRCVHRCEVKRKTLYSRRNGLHSRMKMKMQANANPVAKQDRSTLNPNVSGCRPHSGDCRISCIESTATLQIKRYMLRTFAVCSLSFTKWNICASSIRQAVSVSSWTCVAGTKIPASLFKTSNDCNEHCIFHVVHLNRHSFCSCTKLQRNNGFLCLIFIENQAQYTHTNTKTVKHQPADIFLPGFGFFLRFNHSLLFYTVKFSLKVKAKAMQSQR